jgi:hypothetical protein
VSGPSAGSSADPGETFRPTGRPTLRPRWPRGCGGRQRCRGIEARLGRLVLRCETPSPGPRPRVHSPRAQRHAHREPYTTLLDATGPEQCLKPVDDLEGPYPPGDLEALKQDRRCNAGRKGTTRAHRSSWSCRRR